MFIFLTSYPAPRDLSTTVYPTSLYNIMQAQPNYTQKRFCNITGVFVVVLVAQNTVAEISSNAW